MKALLKIINIVGNVIVLNFLFLLTSVLSLTLLTGTGVSALLATFLDLKSDNSGYYIRNYFKHLKLNWKKTIIIDIFILLFIGFTYLNYLMINNITLEGSVIRLILYCFLGIIVLEVSIISSFIFGVTAKFEGDLKHILYLSFYFSHKYIYLSLLFIILLGLSIFLTIYVSLAFLSFVFGFIFYLEAIILKRIWRDYNFRV